MSRAPRESIPLLRDVLAFVDGHVKFAETKNAAILAADAGIIIGVAQIVSGSTLDGWKLLYFFWVAGMALLSAIAALVSFLPQTHIPWKRTPKKAEAKDNFIFFGDIQKYRDKAYLRALLRAAGESDAGATELERMYAEQIVINSQIASRKFTYFRYAIWLLLHGVLTPVVGLLLYAVVSDRHHELSAPPEVHRGDTPVIPRNRDGP